MLNQKDILSTIEMIDQQHLDIRTITMGISLLDCCDSDPKAACRKIVELSRGTSSFCRICGGCGADNTNYVKTGVQMKRGAHICRSESESMKEQGWNI